MKVNEFVKKFGLEKSKMSVNGFLPMEEGMPVFDYNSEDLKRLIESHELVESCGGLQSVGEKLTHGMYESRAVIARLKQAIADVESCL